MTGAFVVLRARPTVGPAVALWLAIPMRARRMSAVSLPAAIPGTMPALGAAVPMAAGMSDGTLAAECIGPRSVVPVLA